MDGFIRDARRDPQAQKSSIGSFLRQPRQSWSRASHDVIAWEGEGSISREELLRRAAGADTIVSLLTEPSTRNCSMPPGRN